MSNKTESTQKQHQSSVIIDPGSNGDDYAYQPI